MSNFSFLKTEDGILEIFNYNQERFALLGPFSEQILRGPSELSIAEREFLFGYISAKNACSFCFNAHKSIAKEFGIEPSLLDELVSTDSFESVNEKLRPCFELAKKVVTDANRIVPSDVTNITDAGWPESVAHDVICIVGLTTMSNQLVSAHGVIGSQTYFDNAAAAFGPGGSYSTQI